MLQAQRKLTAKEQDLYGVTAPEAKGFGSDTLSFDVSEGQEANNYEKAGYDIVGRAQPLTQQNSDLQASQRSGTTPTLEAKQATVTQPSSPSLPPEIQNAFDQTIALQDTQLKTIQAQYEQFKERSDANLQKTIDSINASMNARAEQMRQTNKAREGSLNLLGARSGRQRYAPEIQTSIISAEEREGIKRLNDIEAQRLQLVAQAEDAAYNQDWNLFNQSFQRIQEANAEKQSTLLRQYELTKQEEQRAFDRANQAIKNEQAILDIQDRLYQRSERTAANAAIGMVTLGEGFSVDMPTSEEIFQQAEALGVDPVVFRSQIQQRADQVSQMSREERSFFLSEQQAQLNLEQGRLNLQKSQALLPLELESKLIDMQTGNLNLERLQLLNERESQMLPWDLQLKQYQLQREEADLQGFYNQMRQEENVAKQQAAGILSTDQIQELDKTPQVKKLQQIKDLKTSLTAYKNLVEELGTAKFSNTQIARLNAAKTDAITAWKDAKALGALTGPDLALAESAIPAAAPSLREGELMIGPIDRLLGPTNNKKILDTLQDSIEAVDQQAVKEINSLKSRGGWAYDNDYTKSIIEPFLDADIPTMTHSYDAFMSTADDQEILSFVDQLDTLGIDQNDENSVREAFELYTSGFNSGASASTQRSDVSNFGTDEVARATTAFGTGTVTGIDGSAFWKPGLDFFLSGGKGAEVSAPFPGIVKNVVSQYSNPNNKPLPRAAGKKQNGGFGNQVVIELDDGMEMSISHLDGVADLTPGQRIPAGIKLGLQGNTGSSYGTTGVHLDITMRDANGKYLSSREVASYLNTQKLT